MDKKVKLAIIGLGQRGGVQVIEGVTYVGMSAAYASMDDVQIVAVCDEYQDRVDAVVNNLKETKNITVKGTTNYMDILNDPDVEAVVILTSWESHVEIAIAAMKAGKAVAMEVGCAYSIEECWDLLKTQQETGAYFMFLENCCYGRTELFLLNLARHGLLGEIVHCSGGYHHDLRPEISMGVQKRHYRLRNYMNRNCDNYPTHELGPIAKILNINNGNRMVSLASFASKSAGLNEYNKHKRGVHNPDPTLVNTKFAQGDFITTVINCAHGETIVITLDTCLPRFGSTRSIQVRGTKGGYIDDLKHLYIEDDNSIPDNSGVPIENHPEKYYEDYKHPLWVEYDDNKLNAGHGGMDWHVMRAFIESYKNGYEPPVDIYDAVTWMSISALSEASIAKGGAVVEIPDFTCGKWIKPTPKKEWKYSL